jgi:hypothetical protein
MLRSDFIAFERNQVLKKMAAKMFRIANVFTISQFGKHARQFERASCSKIIHNAAMCKLAEKNRGEN